MKTCVLLMIWYNFFLSLNLNADSKTYCTRHSRSICSLFYMGQIRKATFNQQQKYSEGERERERERKSLLLTQIIPNIHLSTQCSNFNNRLPKEVIRFSDQL